jgi:hypothetical protein
LGLSITAGGWFACNGSVFQAFITQHIKHARVAEADCVYNLLS